MASTEQTIGRLTAEIGHLTKAVENLTERMDCASEQFCGMRRELDQAKGALAFAKWVAGSSLVSFLAAAIGIWTWLKGAGH